MTIYYSPSTLGFYDTDVVTYPKLPDDCIEISQQDRNVYINEINTMNRKLVLVNGALQLVDREKVITWETIRLQRNELLNASDYTQVPDFSGNKEAWTLYRQQLRDIPQQFANPEDVEWPVEPNN